MTKENVTKFFKGIQKGVSDHSPEILTALGIAGMITSTVLAVKATPKAIRLIEEKKRAEHTDELTAMETVKATWKCYIPATITGATSIMCLVGANSVNARRNAALATAYKISETAFHDYKAKVVETIGEKKEQIIKDKIAQDKVDNMPAEANNNIIITGKGHTQCYDAVFGQRFESDIDAIKRAVNEINYQMLSQEYMSLNDFYRELNIDTIEIGDDLGWNISRDGKLEVTFSSALKDGEPMLVMHYLVVPRYGYDRYNY